MPAQALIFDHFEVSTDELGAPIRLGPGGMGTTYRAFDTRLRKHVALKLINDQLLRDPTSRLRFFNEARAAALIDHPNVARVLYLCPEDAAQYFYAMELVDGESLASRVMRYGPIAPSEALLFLRPVADALTALGEHHLVHRDIKPENIMIARTGSTAARVKLIDFGLAKSLAAHERFADVETGDRFIGSVYFASPEQIRSREQLDARSDFYSLGATLWHVLTGFPPFTGTVFEVQEAHVYREPYWDKIAEAPAPVSALLRRLLAKSREGRPSDAGQLFAEWDAAITGLEQDRAAAAKPLAVSPAPIAPADLGTTRMDTIAAKLKSNPPARMSEDLRDTVTVPKLPSALAAMPRDIPEVPPLPVPVDAPTEEGSRSAHAAPPALPVVSITPPTPSSGGVPRPARSRPAWQKFVLLGSGLAVLLAGGLFVRALVAPLFAPGPPEAPRPGGGPGPGPGGGPPPGPGGPNGPAPGSSSGPIPVATPLAMTPPHPPGPPGSDENPPVQRPTQPATADPTALATADAPFQNTLGMEFVPVPETGILMGSKPVRVSDFAAFATAIDYHQTGGSIALKIDLKKKINEWVRDPNVTWQQPGFPQRGDCPVVAVSWVEANAFCQWLSVKEGRIYRLPTDDEWSTAAGFDKYPWGNSWPPPPNSGNFLGSEVRSGVPSSVITVPGYTDPFPRTAPVGSFTPNRLGIYDLAGNVWQWCMDEYRASLNEPALRSIYPSLNVEHEPDGVPYRIRRGVSWSGNDEVNFRTGFRLAAHPTNRNVNAGFRLVLARPEGAATQSAEPTPPQPTGNGNTPPRPRPPTEATGRPDPRELIGEFLRSYVGNTDTLDAEAAARYFAPSVEYYDEGKVDREYIRRDSVRYHERWPQQSQTLEGEPVITMSPDGAAASVEFTIHFDVRNGPAFVRGKTAEKLELSLRGGHPQIVSVKSTVLEREKSAAPVPTPVRGTSSGLKPPRR